MDQQQRSAIRAASRRRWVPAFVVVALTVAAACSSGGRQEVRSGGRGSALPGAATPTTGPVSTVIAPPPAFDEARARYEAVRAPAGKLVGRASTAVVDDVALRRAVRVRARGGLRTVRSARRIRITGGPFPYGDARVLVLLDGRSVGEGQVADQGRTLTVAVFDPALIRAGTLIGYQIEPRRPVTVGMLRVGG